MHDASELAKSSGKRAVPPSCFTNQSGYRIQWGHKLLGTFHSAPLGTRAPATPGPSSQAGSQMQAIR